MLEKSRLFAESWNVAWRRKKTGTIIEDTNTEFTVIKNSFRYWAADPFLFEYNHEVYIFAELYDYIRCRGILGYYKLNGENSGKWIPIITEDYHISYPNIYRYGKDIFIIPEANASGQLYLYKAIKFPNKWEKSHVLRTDVAYADTTPFVWAGGKKALTYRVTDPYHPELYYLDLENPAGDKRLELPCPERRRPAGQVFRYQGKMIRPAQDCTEDYGKGLIFYEYTIDSHGEYFEIERLSLTPHQLTFSHRLYLDGMHTYNCSEHYEVIDVKTRRFNPLNLIFRFLSKLF